MGGGNYNYVGIHTILDPKTCKPIEYDVYSVDGFWFNGATLYFYINRVTGILSTQLYFQSELENPGPNYFWWMYSDMSNGITPEEYQNILNGKQRDYYFGFSDDHLKSCPNYEVLVASGAIEEYSFGNSYNTTDTTTSMTTMDTMTTSFNTTDTTTSMTTRDTITTSS